MSELRFLIQDAYAFAAERHGGQVYAGLPFQYHLDQVVMHLMRYGLAGPVYTASALLHDVIEDTPTSREEIRERFGEEVAAIVWACTGVGKNRKERNADIYRKLDEYPRAAVVKVADRLANHAASRRIPCTNKPDHGHVRMYLSERSEFEAAVRAHIPSAMWQALQQDYVDFLIILEGPKS